MFWSEAVQSIRGAWRLAMLDPSGMNSFNLTLEGFRRSFLVYLYIAPIYLLIEVIAPRGMAIPMETLLGVKLVTYAARIAASTLLLALLCHLLRVGERFVPLMVASNWATVLQIALWFAVVSLAARGIGRFGDLLQVAATMAMLFYGWFIIRTALGLGTLSAIGVLAADTFSSELLGMALNRLFGLTPFIPNA